GRERSLPSAATLELRRFLVSVKAHPELIRGRRGRAPRSGASTRTVAEVVRAAGGHHLRTPGATHQQEDSVPDYQESREASPLLVIRAHPPVVGVDGPAGHATYVLLGADGRVRGLTVRLALRRRAVLLPLQAVMGADEDAVSTRLGRDDIDALEEMNPDDSPSGTLLGAGQAAVGWDGKLGPVIL